jgi:hypothetical protein
MDSADRLRAGVFLTIQCSLALAALSEAVHFSRIDR